MSSRSDEENDPQPEEEDNDQPMKEKEKEKEKEEEEEDTLLDLSDEYASEIKVILADDSERTIRSKAGQPPS